MESNREGGHGAMDAVVCACGAKRDEKVREWKAGVSIQVSCAIRVGLSDQNPHMAPCICLNVTVSSVALRTAKGRG